MLDREREREKREDRIRLETLEQEDRMLREKLEMEDEQRGKTKRNRNSEKLKHDKRIKA